MGDLGSAVGLLKPDGSSELLIYMTCSDSLLGAALTAGANFEQSGSKQRLGFCIDGASESSGPEEVHGYEVQLVLEYCDRSSLRDALDSGIGATCGQGKERYSN
eukprot:1161363-Pelagomonas_calceolata.AAC.2